MFKLEDLELPPYSFIETKIQYEVEHPPHIEMRFSEPKWMIDERIRRSLPYLTEIILDEYQPIQNYYSDSPLFLEFCTDKWTSNRRNGRIPWMNTLGTYKFEPAYNNLREIWLHDLNELVRHYAFESLAKMKSERFLKDVKTKILKFDNVEDWSHYIRKISENYDCDEALEIIDLMRDFILYINDGILLTKEEVHLMEVDQFYNGHMQFVIEDLLWAYREMSNNPKARKSRDKLVNRNKSNKAIPFLRKYSAIREEEIENTNNKPKPQQLIKPEKPNRKDLFRVVKNQTVIYEAPSF